MIVLSWLCLRLWLPCAHAPCMNLLACDCSVPVVPKPLQGAATLPEEGRGGHSLATEPKACARMQVGAALSMVYTSGAPIMFVGCGQTYVDLKRLNVKSVVRSLLK